MKKWLIKKKTEEVEVPWKSSKSTAAFVADLKAGQPPLHVQLPKIAGVVSPVVCYEVAVSAAFESGDHK